MNPNFGPIKKILDKNKIEDIDKQFPLLATIPQKGIFNKNLLGGYAGKITPIYCTSGDGNEGEDIAFYLNGEIMNDKFVGNSKLAIYRHKSKHKVSECISSGDLTNHIRLKVREERTEEGDYCLIFCDDDQLDTRYYQLFFLNGDTIIIGNSYAMVKGRFVVVEKLLLSKIKYIFSR